MVRRKIWTIFTSIIMITCIVSMITIKSYAVDETNTNKQNTNNTGNSSNASNSNTTNSNTNAEEDRTKLKNNAALKMLGIRPNDFSGFRYGTFSYDVTVPEKLEEIEVYATAQNPNATISGTGKKTLKSGKNKFDVVVTAEDGKTKLTYTINVTREGEEETEENEENEKENTNQEENVNQTEKKGLSELEIVSVKLNPIFETDIYEYTADYIGDNVKMNIQTKTTDESYKVEITGNEELKEGENLINILVTDKDGKNVATYQITLNKSIEDKEALQKEQEEANAKKEEQKKLIIGGVVAGVIVILIIILIIRHRRNKRFAEEYSIPYSNFNQDEYEENEENEEEPEELASHKKEELKRKFLDGYGTSQEESNEVNYEEEIKEKEDLVKEKDLNKK